MILDVDPHSGVPVYRQLMDQVRFHVASGLLEPGAELPSTRVLSARLGVNPMTVSKAYGLLEAEGLLERRPGRRLVVRDQDGEQAKTRRTDQLRSALRPVVTAVRQLGMDDRVALETFRELLEEQET